MSELLATKQVIIQATPDRVWRALTDVTLIPQWMSETEMNVETGWSIGGSIIIQGRWHKMRYRNVGKVLEFRPGRVLSYSHLSSLSRLPDLPENHSHLTFTLDPVEGGTLVRLTISNSPTFEIHKHLDFYWNVTLQELAQFVQTH